MKPTEITATVPDSHTMVHSESTNPFVDELDRRRSEAKRKLHEATSSSGPFRERLIIACKESVDHLESLTPKDIADQKLQEERVALKKRSIVLRDFIKQRGRRYESCRINNYVVEHSHQERVINAIRVYAEHFEKNVRAGIGIVLFGTAGTGKDHILSALSRFAIMNHGFTVVWSNGPSLWSELKACFDKHSFTSEREILRRLTRPDILYVSDPVVALTSLSDYETKAFYQLIDARYNALKPTWLSMNAAKRNAMNDSLGTATVDRLVDGALTLGCDWPSFRTTRDSSRRRVVCQ